MPWWVWFWIGGLMLFMVGGTVDDWSNRVARWKIVGDVLIHALTIAFILAYYSERLGDAIGRLLIPAVVLALAWDLARTIEEMREMTSDPDVSFAENRGLWLGATLGWAAMLLPAFALGAIEGARHW